MNINDTYNNNNDIEKYIIMFKNININNMNNHIINNNHL